ncbi:MAG: GAF and ANTAR domain-containing protein [Actinomycetes bacterium]
MPQGGDGVDDELLTNALSEFARTLAGRYDVSEVLYHLAEHVIAILGVRGAGVSVVDDSGRLRPVTGINQLTLELETVEEELQEGPCVDAFRRGEVVVVDDIREPELARWPRWARTALERDVHSVLGIPLCVRAEPLGAMNIYSGERRSWHPSEVRVARVLTDMAASYVANASDLEESRRTTEQLREALQSRIVIEQAKGIISAEQRCSVDDAFRILREHSRRHSASLRDVAHAVVHVGLRPSGSRPGRRP